MDQLVPEVATRMECLVVHETLQRVKAEILSGRPSGQVIDQAIEQSIEVGSKQLSQEAHRHQ